MKSENYSVEDDESGLTFSNRTMLIDEVPDVERSLLASLSDCVSDDPKQIKREPAKTIWPTREGRAGGKGKARAVQRGVDGSVSERGLIRRSMLGYAEATRDGRG